MLNKRFARLAAALGVVAGVTLVGTVAYSATNHPDPASANDVEVSGACDREQYGKVNVTVNASNFHGGVHTVTVAGPGFPETNHVVQNDGTDTFAIVGEPGTDVVTFSWTSDAQPPQGTFHVSFVECQPATTEPPTTEPPTTEPPTTEPPTTEPPTTEPPTTEPPTTEPPTTEPPRHNPPPPAQPPVTEPPAPSPAPAPAPAPQPRDQVLHTK